MRSSSANGRPVFSFEFFPPKTEEGERNLYDALAELKSLRARLRLGHLRRGRLDARQDDRDRVAHQAGVRPGGDGALHLRRRHRRRAAHDAGRDGRRSGSTTSSPCAATRPQGQEEWTKTEGGLEFSRELVELISRATTRFAIGAACFPETHIHATSPEDDLRYLKEKVDAGARFLITQLFFDNALYYDFVARARDVGIDVPIIPGILPITNIAQITRITTLCGGDDPRAALQRSSTRAPTSPRRSHDFGVAYATLQCADLLAKGAPGIHFYTLNRSPATRAILSALKLIRPWERPASPPSPRRLDLEPLGDHRAGRRALVAHVDRVVLAVGADAPGAEEPAPAADLVLAQLAVEDERVALDAVVDARLLGHAVDEDVERRLDLRREPDERAGHVARSVTYPAGRRCPRRYRLLRPPARRAPSASASPCDPHGERRGRAARSAPREREAAAAVAELRPWIERRLGEAAASRERIAAAGRDRALPRRRP